MFVCLCTMCVPDTLEGQKTALSPMALELQMVVSYYVILGTEPEFSGKAVSAFNY